MARRSEEAPIDYISLAEFLAAVGYPVRLALLDKLRFPQKASDVHLTPHRVHQGRNPDRPLARQTVQNHIDKLVEQDIVQAIPTEESGQQTTYYVANPSRLYALTEELGRLSLRYAGTGKDAEETGTIARAVRPPTIEDPHLMLVHGVYMGEVYPLNETTGERGRWIIGRSKQLAVSLDYDPYVSSENTIIERDGGSFVLHDLERSKNGTMVNFQRMDRGGTHRLKAGDVIGVGRSLLVFVPE